MAAVDYFKGKHNLDDPYTTAAAVTPHDTNELAFVTRALCIGTAGALKVTMMDGTDTTFAGVPVGVIRLRVKRVFSTGTVAANITALM